MIIIGNFFERCKTEHEHMARMEELRQREIKHYGMGLISQTEMHENISVFEQQMHDNWFDCIVNEK